VNIQSSQQSARRSSVELASVSGSPPTHLPTANDPFNIDLVLESYIDMDFGRTAAALQPSVGELQTSVSLTRGEWTADDETSMHEIVLTSHVLLHDIGWRPNTPPTSALGRSEGAPAMTTSTLQTSSTCCA